MALFSGFAAKLALRKSGISTDGFIYNGPIGSPRQPNKLRKRQPPSAIDTSCEDSGDNSWAAWISSWDAKSLPITVHPWLSPPPPPVQVASTVPNVGSSAPLDRSKRLQLGGGRRCLVVFLRCVGCAFAKKTFLNLRALGNRYPDKIRCIAVSHSSREATRRWIDLLGGAWDVEIINDEDRSLYALWGLGVAGIWYLLHPEVQMTGWRDKEGWLGDEVADYLQRRGLVSPKEVASPHVSTFEKDDDDEEQGVRSVLGSKWQEAGAFAVDGKGTVVWGGKAERADDVMDLELGGKILLL